MVNADTSMTFNQEEMSRLYAEGVRDGISVPTWRCDPRDLPARSGSAGEVNPLGARLTAGRSAGCPDRAGEWKG